MAATAVRALGRYSYLGMAVLLAAIVWYGFSHTIEENLFHGSFPRPAVLYVHAAVFGGWMALFLVQSGLIAFARKPSWHRRLGRFGAALGATMPVLGVWSALRMTHLRFGYGDTDSVAFLVLAFWDMAVFATLLALAIGLRGQPEAHRRLMLLATCGLCVAALTRFPPWLPAPERGVWLYYAYADALMLLGPLRDLIVLGRVHPIYWRALPVLFIGQAICNAIYMMRPAAWMHLAEWLIR